MGFSRQEHWSGLPCPPPGDLPEPGIEPISLTSPALAGEGPLPLAPAGKLSPNVLLCPWVKNGLSSLQGPDSL